MAIVEVAPGREWHALDDDVVVGRAHVLRRPDRRVFVAVDAWHADVGAALLDAVLDAVPGPLHAVLGEDDAVQRALFGLAGFAEVRREDEVLVPVTAVPAGARPGPPAGIELVSAADVPVEQLCRLDEQLRGDVPGTAGWVNDLDTFRELSFDPRWFDPATYVVALAGGEPVGLVRVHRRARVPRLGLVGVLPAHRRRGLATALLHRAFAPLVAAGTAEVSAEVDAADTAAWALLRRHGAYRTGGTVELRCDAQPTKTQNGWPAGSP